MSWRWDWAADLDEIIRAIRKQGIIPTLITNGYLLTASRIERLNRAGPDHIELCIDNVPPDEVSKKSLKVLDQKLVLLTAFPLSRSERRGRRRREAEIEELHAPLSPALFKPQRTPDD
jgi:MoaA/NifB/PqqE/SkfB family radical SAM enzyme